MSDQIDLGKGIQVNKLLDAVTIEEDSVDVSAVIDGFQVSEQRVIG